MSALIVRRNGTSEEVHRVDTTAKSESSIDRIERGMLINLDVEQFHIARES